MASVGVAPTTISQTQISLSGVGMASTTTVATKPEGVSTTRIRKPVTRIKTVPSRTPVPTETKNNATPKHKRTASSPLLVATAKEGLSGDKLESATVDLTPAKATTPTRKNVKKSDAPHTTRGKSIAAGTKTPRRFSFDGSSNSSNKGEKSSQSIQSQPQQPKSARKGSSMQVKTDNLKTSVSEHIPRKVRKSVVESNKAGSSVIHDPPRTAEKLKQNKQLKQWKDGEQKKIESRTGSPPGQQKTELNSSHDDYTPRGTRKIRRPKGLDPNKEVNAKARLSPKRGSIAVVKNIKMAFESKLQSTKNRTKSMLSPVPLPTTTRKAPVSPRRHTVLDNPAVKNLATQSKVPRRDKSPKRTNAEKEKNVAETVPKRLQQNSKSIESTKISWSDDPQGSASGNPKAKKTQFSPPLSPKMVSLDIKPADLSSILAGDIATLDPSKGLATRQQQPQKSQVKHTSGSADSKARSKSLRFSVVSLAATLNTQMTPKRHNSVDTAAAVKNYGENDTVPSTEDSNENVTKIDESSPSVENQKTLEKDQVQSKDSDSRYSQTLVSAVTRKSTKGLSSTCHGQSLSPKRTKAIRTANARRSLGMKPTHLNSNYAGDIATFDPIMSRRSSLQDESFMENQSEKTNQARRASVEQPTDSPKIKGANNASSKPLTFFGSPLVPIDLVEESMKKSKLNLMHHKDAAEVLEQIKHMKRRDLKVKAELIHSSSITQQQQKNETLPQELKCIQLLRTAGTASSATLSLTGYKGGALEDQINHDRSLIVSPFFLKNHEKSPVRRRLMGVFDGHAEKGAVFAEHCQQRLPAMLSRKLSEAFRKAVEDIAAGNKVQEDEVDITKRVLVESFLAVHESSPKEESGGCTATVVYQQGQKVFVANAGDSRSFIVVCHKNQLLQGEFRKEQEKEQKENASPKASNHPTSPSSTSRKDTNGVPVKVVYRSRDDKPDLPEERKRLEARGSEIIPPEGMKSAKVKIDSNRPGKGSATLSMSRSIGDWQFSSHGVIPDPIVDVTDIRELVEQEKKADQNGRNIIDDVCIFAVSVSDGVMIEGNDNVEAIASDLAPSLFMDNAPHPLTACQGVISKAAAVWDRRNKGKFRDDITVAVTVLRTTATTVLATAASSSKKQAQTKSSK